MKKFLATFIFTMVFLTGCGGVQVVSSDGKVKDSDKIIIGIDEFAPMGFLDEHGNIVGFEVDLAKEAARRMGITAQFKQIDWQDKQAEITSGNVDMIWNGLDITDENKEYMIFSKPYMDNRRILLVKHGNPHDIRSEADLAGKIVGTQAGSNSESHVLKNAAVKDSFAAFKSYRTFKDALAALDGGEVVALIIDEIAARYEMVKSPNKFEPVEVTIGAATQFGIGFRKEDTALRDKVQSVFDDMIKDGTARKISEQWFQADLIKARR